MQVDKDLVAASASPLVLAILRDEGESYGYAIIKRVSELSGGKLEWTDGMLYPVLHRLEKRGYVEARWGRSDAGRRRKYYRLTEEGSAELTRHRRQWELVDDTLRALWFVGLAPAPDGGSTT